MMPDRGPHLDGDEAESILTHLKSAKNEERQALMAQLAWRPAWAIRSRKGALRAFLAWLRGAGRD